MTDIDKNNAEIELILKELDLEGPKRREAHVSDLVDALKLEGVELTSEQLSITLEYINGEIDIVELNRILSMDVRIRKLVGS